MGHMHPTRCQKLGYSTYADSCLIRRAMPFLYLYARFRREFYPGRRGILSDLNARCIATDNEEILVSISFFHLTVVLSHYSTIGHMSID